MMIYGQTATKQWRQDLMLIFQHLR